MIPGKNLELLEAWKSDAFAELGISEVMRNAHKRTKPWVFNTLEALAKAGLLAKKKKGNINLYALNMNNPLLVQTLQFVEAWNNYNFARLDVIEETIGKIPPSGYCLLVFGSYAEGKQTKDSD